MPIALLSRLELPFLNEPFSTQAYELLPSDSPARAREPQQRSRAGGADVTTSTRRGKGRGRQYVLFVTMFVGVAIVAASWALPGARSSREAEGQDGGALYSSDPLTASFPDSTLPNIVLNRNHLPIFRPPSPLPPPPSDILPYPSPSLLCLQHLYTLSASSPISFTLCPPPTSPVPLDIVITFVNGSSPSFLAAYASTVDLINAQPPSSPRQKGPNMMGQKPWHYSEMGEMRYAVRSTRLLGGKQGREGVVRGVTADFAVEKWEDGGLTETAKRRITGKGWRVGQVPNWLDWTAAERERVKEGLPFGPDGKQGIRKTSPVPASPIYKPFDEPNDPHARSISLPPPSSESASNASKPISFHFHSEIFLPPNASTSPQSDYLPTYNSFSIESQLHNIPHLTSNFVSINDDFFLLRETSTSDFYSEIFGPVFRFQNNLQVKPKEDVWAGDPGEWAGLEWAAHVLNKRLPSSHLEYLIHIPKTLSAPHLHELHLTFPEALGAASKRRFREQKTGGADIEIAFLLTHYIRQRHREALLWSYVIARPAPASVWSRPEREELKALGVDGWTGKIGRIVKPKPASAATVGERSGAWRYPGGAGGGRPTGEEDAGDGLVRWEKERIQEGLREVAQEEMMVTEVHFSSLSGIPSQNFQTGPDRSLNLSECLGDWWTTSDPNVELDAEWLFRRLAFDKVECGDRLITAILSLTTEPGLTSLLPRPNAAFPLSTIGSFAANASLPSIYTSPHLPLTPTHESASFSLLSLFPPIVHPSFLSNSSSPLPFISPYISTSFKPSHPNTTPMLQLLPFTLSLLSRYRHTLGSTPSYFTSLRGPYSFKKLRKDLAKAPEMAFLCVNDDLPTWADREAMKRSVREWGEEMWPMKGEWEL